MLLVNRSCLLCFSCLSLSVYPPPLFTRFLSFLFSSFLLSLSLLPSLSQHYGQFYAKIHKIHHEFRAPIGMASEYAHPIEMLFSNIVPIMTGPFLIRSHILVAWLWFAIGVVGKGKERREESQERGEVVWCVSRRSVMISSVFLSSFAISSPRSSFLSSPISTLILFTHELTGTISHHCGYKFPWLLGSLGMRPFFCSHIRWCYVVMTAMKYHMLLHQFLFLYMNIFMIYTNIDIIACATVLSKMLSTTRHCYVALQSWCYLCHFGIFFVVLNIFSDPQFHDYHHYSFKWNFGLLYVFPLPCSLPFVPSSLIACLSLLSALICVLFVGLSFFPLSSRPLSSSLLLFLHLILFFLFSGYLDKLHGTDQGFDKYKQSIAAAAKQQQKQWHLWHADVLMCLLPTQIFMWLQPIVVKLLL